MGIFSNICLRWTYTVHQFEPQEHKTIFFLVHFNHSFFFGFMHGISITLNFFCVKGAERHYPCDISAPVHNRTQFSGLEVLVLLGFEILLATPSWFSSDIIALFSSNILSDYVSYFLIFKLKLFFYPLTSSTSDFSSFSFKPNTQYKLYECQDAIHFFCQSWCHAHVRFPQFFVLMDEMQTRLCETQ